MPVTVVAPSQLHHARGHDQTQADFETRIFGHYGCGDAVGDWEILVYSMLLDHAPTLISGDSVSKASTKRGRKRKYTSEWGDALGLEIERVMTDPSAPPDARETKTGALKHLFKSAEFRGRFAINSRLSERELAKSVLERLREANKLNLDTPGKSAA